MFKGSYEGTHIESLVIAEQYDWLQQHKYDHLSPHVRYFIKMDFRLVQTVIGAIFSSDLIGYL